ncbi:biliverdin-producing heme oxygenase [Pedobacter sp. AW1-32]|uniref:biliverdin-producing heme oxygenase n=1 Tax=Pedobacter sp. AW1-32 TaxID=3383026 RepID=UPI003FEEF214
MIANLLRTETAGQHQSLENLMFVNQIMNKTLSTDEYKKLLTVNYIIHKELEGKLIKMLDPGVALALDMKSRVKISHLEEDLHYWEIDAKALPQLNFDLFVPGQSTAEILGALYVLEGATLGGNVIKKHLLENPNFDGKEAGLNYYGVYGAEIGAKWKTFVSVLNSNVTEADYQACIHSANETFNNLIKLSNQLK